jgi:serine/threonine protein kinase/WD40 repeat protein
VSGFASGYLTMTGPNHCEHCGSPIAEAGVLGNACPVCLMERGLDSTSGFGYLTTSVDSAAHDSSPGSQPPSIGRYKILRLIGEGGMGAVYEAEQEYPRRMVALKILKPGVTNSRTLRRFEQEAQALGRLQHPGIAQIYEAGTADTGFGPQPYFAMELIRGQSPRDYVKQHGLGIRERLELVAKMAEAVHHAHQRGLIHRDLKPNNILVDETGQPKVLDFGVARAIGTDVEVTQQTDEGQLVGTLAYMSPEQVLADPQEIDTRTDVYALGIILYELLAGRLPYNTKGKLHETLTAIREEDPPPLGTLDRSYRGDIETIAAKALEKDKARRYTSAAELAADIRRYLADEPIAARPPTASYQLKKFARRNRALVLGGAAVFTALVAGVVVSSWLLVRALRSEQEARTSEATVTHERNIALAAGQRAKDSESDAIKERDRAAAAEETSRREATVAKTQRLIATWQSLVQESLRESARRSEWDRGALLAVQAMRFNARIPNQPRQGVEAALQQSIVEGAPHKLADYGTMFFALGITRFRALAFSPDGSRLAGGGFDGYLFLWKMRNPGALPFAFRSVGRETTDISSIAISPDGKRVAVGSLEPNDSNLDTIRVWDLQNPSAPPLVLEGGGSIESLTFAPDSIHLASVAVGYQGPRSSRNPVGVIVWDLRDPKAIQVLSRNTLPTNSSTYGRVGFSPDGARVAVATAETVELWNLQSPSGEPISLRPQPTALSAPLNFPFAVNSVAFSPDGEHLAISSSYGVQIWDLLNLQTAPVDLRTMNPSGYPVRLLTYASDGTRLAGSTVLGVSIWDVRNPRSSPLSYSPTPNEGIDVAAYSSKGALVAAVTPSGLLVWDLGTVDRQPSISSALPGPGIDPSRTHSWTDIAYSGDLSRLADVTRETVRFWETGKPDASPMTIGGGPTRAAGPILGGGARTYTSVTLCREGTRVVAASPRDSGIRLSSWELSNAIQPQLLVSLDIADAGQYSRPLGCSPDGTRIAVSGATIHVVDLQTPNAPPLSLGQTRPDTVSALVFSPDGNKLAVGRYDHTVELWDLRKPGVQPLILHVSEPKPFVAGVVTLAFSPDGERLAASVPGRVQVWDLRDLYKKLWQQFPGSSPVAFSPDGKELATSADGFVRIWDLQNPAAPALDLPWPASVPNVPNALSFSPDGMRLSAGTWLGTVVVWRLWSAAADYLCSRVWRNLSIQEWRLNVGEGIPYESTCPALPPGFRPMGPIVR